MVRIPVEQELLPSVLDRLLDDAPESDHEPMRSSAQKMRDLHESVKRDLEDLLNTRRRCEGWSSELIQLDDSLVNYGLPDFFSMNLVTQGGRDAFNRMLQEIISRWEPRLDNVRVSLSNDDLPFHQTLRFRIEALLWIEPNPEPIVFDSTLEPVTGNFTVTGER